MVIGLACGVAGFAAFGLAITGAWFLAGIPLTALWGIASAATLGLMSRYVGASEQGQLQGANSSLMGIANPLGPASSPRPSRYSWVQAPPCSFRRAVLLAGLMLVAAIAVAVCTTREPHIATAAAAADMIAAPGPLRRRLHRQQPPCSLVVELAGLRKSGRHIATICSATVRRLERHRVFAGHGGGAHAGAGRPRVDQVDAHIGGDGLGGIGERQRVERRLGDRVGAAIGARFWRRRR